MACFIVPAAEAIAVAAVSHILKSRENKLDDKWDKKASNKLHIQFSRKLNWLYKTLGGGSLILAFEHIWHGEIEPWFPFLTSAKDSESTAIMLREMSTVGVGMAAAVTAVWLLSITSINIIQKHTNDGLLARN